MGEWKKVRFNSNFLKVESSCKPCCRIVFQKTQASPTIEEGAERTGPPLQSMCSRFTIHNPQFARGSSFTISLAIFERLSIGFFFLWRKAVGGGGGGGGLYYATTFSIIMVQFSILLFLYFFLIL